MQASDLYSNGNTACPNRFYMIFFSTPDKHHLFFPRLFQFINPFHIISDFGNSVFKKMCIITSQVCYLMKFQPAKII